ncbi:MAG: ROK family protein [Sulfurospirillum sp.]|nr:ROK family protein [Sulfurospirillum sp.]
MKLCIDAGGTYFRYELYENNQQIGAKSEKNEGVGICFWIENILQQYPKIQIIAVGYAGQVKDGIILASPNITIDKANIKSYFEQKYGVKFFIQNDLECAVLAEANFHKSPDICALYLGSGMGLGVISGGKLLQGFGGVATEIGHIPYKKSPFTCGCGRDNCIELFASGIGLLGFKKYLSLDANLTLEQLRVAQSSLYTQFEEALLYAVGTVITLFNPQILVLGGGIFASDSELFAIVSEKYANFTLLVSAKQVTIKKTQIQNAVLSGTRLLGV